MFAPSISRPPFYPSYAPPSARELTSLLTRKAALALHGSGAENETWKVKQGVHLRESDEGEVGSREMAKTSVALSRLRKKLKQERETKAAGAGAGAGTAPSQSDGAADGAASNGISVGAFRRGFDPSPLIYTDPYAYSAHLERMNAPLLNMMALPSDRIATLKTTAFLRYLYEGMFCCDVGRLETEWFDLAMQFLDRTPNLHTLLLHDSWHLRHGSVGSATAAQMASRARARSQPLREKSTTLGGGVAGAKAKTSKTGGLRFLPDERKVITGLELSLPPFLQRNASTLVHLELCGVVLSDWSEILNLILACKNLQRLYLRLCNIGDKKFVSFGLGLREMEGLKQLALEDIGLTSQSASLICSLIKTQSESRATIHWAQHLREESTPPPSPSILLPHNLSAEGLISLDLRNNRLGDKGVSLIAGALARDTWIKSIDLSGNGFGEEGLREIISMLEENRTILWIQIQGKREENVHPYYAEGGAQDGGALTSARRRASGGSMPFTESSSTLNKSGMRLLRQFDPHWSKRHKRLLLLFHTQTVEIRRFYLGRDPTPIRGADGKPVEAVFDRSVKAEGVMSKFFEPATMLAALPSGAFDTAKSGERRPIRPRTAFGKRSGEGGDTLSPTLQTFAAKQQQQCIWENEEKQKEEASTVNTSKRRRPASARHPPSATATSPSSPIPAALNFLFPELVLICPPDRLFHPDISLRSKPPRTDSGWAAGHRATSSISSRHGENAHHLRRSSDHALSTSSSTSSLSFPLSNGSTPHYLDFRPALRETCVASIESWVAAEKILYKQSLKETRADAARSDNASVPSHTQDGDAVVVTSSSSLPQPQDDVQYLMDENQRLYDELAQLKHVQAQQRESEAERDRAAATFDPSTLPELMSLASAARDGTLSKHVTELTGQGQSGWTEEKLLAFLEEQFQLMNAYMDKMERRHAAEQEREREQIGAGHPSDSHPSSHVHVERVEESPSPTAASSSSAAVSSNLNSSNLSQSSPSKRPTISSVDEQHAYADHAHAQQQSQVEEELRAEEAGRRMEAVEREEEQTRRQQEEEDLHRAASSMQSTSTEAETKGKSEVEEDIESGPVVIQSQLTESVSQRMSEMYNLDEEKGGTVTIAGQSLA